MSTKYYLPPREVFVRYEPRVRFNLIRGYHRKMAAKHRWFIREFNGGSYYMDNDKLPRVDAQFYEIFDCGWSPEEWDTRPFKYNVTTTSVTEEYRAERSQPFPIDYEGQTVGYRRSGNWTLKIYDENGRYFVRGEEGWHTNNNGIYTRYSEKTGEITVGTFGNEIAVKKVFDKEVLPVLRGMKAVKWRGFYDEDIEYVLSTANLDRRFL